MSVEEQVTVAQEHQEPTQQEAVEPEVQPVEAIKKAASAAELEAKILKQVEFYFGDSNLPRDKFLSGKVQEREGWVDVAVLASFARMKALSEDLAVITEAISKSAELLELNEDRTAVRRRIPLPESKDTMALSVYVKGFPTTLTLDDLEAFFRASASEKVQAIRMRRTVDDAKTFKGSVFVELDSAEEATRVAALELKWEETPLVVMTKMAYFESKNSERAAKKTKRPAEEEAKEERPFEYTKGCLLCIESVPEEVTAMQIKEHLNKDKEPKPVAFVGLKDGKATIRFSQALTEESITAHAELPLTEEVKLAARPATEEEETAFFAAFHAELKERKRSAPNRGRGRGGRGKRGRRS